MDIIEIIKEEYLSIIFGGLGGVLAAFFTQKILNKRGLFSYFVTHNRVGVSSQDTVFGDVSVAWNNNAVENLFFSTIELKNESLIDYENVVIQTYTSDTKLLTEFTRTSDSPNILLWTDSYKSKVHVEEGEKPTEVQFNIHQGQREYVIPVFNRGQQVYIEYLNTANTSEMPNIWLSATIKGVKVKFRNPETEVYGVSRRKATIVGVILGLLLLVPLVLFIPNSWAIGLAALGYGFFVVFPGVFIIKGYRRARDLVGG